MSKHAFLSPSSSHRWLVCPGSARMEEGLESTNIYAEIGTAAHKASADILLTGCHEGNYDGIEITDEMKIFIRKYTNEINYYMTHCFFHEPKLYVEVELPVGLITGEKDAVGTADAVILNGTELQVHDLKYGMMRVPAENNTQLMLYALAAIEKYDILPSLITLVIHQPRVNSTPDEWSLRYEDLLNFKHDVRITAELIMMCEKGELLIPEFKACQYCKAAGFCDALTESVEKELGVDIRLLDDKGDIKERDLGLILSKIPLIELWCAEKKKEAYKQATSGTPIAGHKLVQGRDGKREWVDTKAVFNYIKSKRIPLKKITETKLLSPAQMRKVIDESLWDGFKNFITRADGKLTLVEESDEREAVTTTFSNIEGEANE